LDGALPIPKDFRTLREHKPEQDVNFNMPRWVLVA
jgi:hypothetical protein